MHRRSPTTVRILAATILAASIGACGSSNGPAASVDASHDTSSPRSDAAARADSESTTGFADQYDTAVCRMLARLHMVSGQQYCLSLATAAYRGQVGFNSLEAHLAAVSAGKSTFDEKRAAECLAALESVSSFFNTYSALEACANLFHGTLADGESCIADGECLPGRVCYLGSGDCAGVCKQFGSHCNYDADCPSGQVCNVQSGCVVPVPPGANGQACGTNVSCQQGLLCSSPNTCKPPPTEGQPCDDLTCADGLICANTVCARARSKGDACQTGQCGGMLFSDLTCDPASHVCVDAFIGGPCAPPIAGLSFEVFLGLSGHWMRWASGCDSLVSYCDWRSTTCIAYPLVGAACDPSFGGCGPAATCKPNESDDSTAGTCTRISSCSP